MKQLIKYYTRDTRAATAVEYGLIIAAIAVVISAGVFFLGESVSGSIDSMGDAIEP